MRADPTARILTVHEHTEVSEGEMGSESLRRLEALSPQLPSRALTFLRHGFRTGSYVGLIQVGEFALQIVPKIFAKPEDSLGVLVYMLHFTQKPLAHEGGAASLEALRAAPLLEIWTRGFAERSRNLLRHRMRREYREVSEQTTFIRGKILVERMQGGQEQLSGRYPCRYELFGSDHQLNRLIRFCSRLLLRTVRDEKTRTMLREIDALLVDVELAYVSLREADLIRLNRLNREYQPVLEFCRLLLRHSSIDLRAGRIQQFSVLIEMNDLFERFVIQMLIRNRDHLHLARGQTVQEVTAKPRIGQLFGEFKMEPDVLLSLSDGSQILVDAKYKSLDEEERHQGLNQKDFYQMFGYSRGGAKRYDDIILVYPRTSGQKRDYVSGGTRLRVRHIDLHRFFDQATGRVVADVDYLNEALA